MVRVLAGHQVPAKVLAQAALQAPVQAKVLAQAALKAPVPAKVLAPVVHQVQVHRVPAAVPKVPVPAATTIHGHTTLGRTILMPLVVTVLVLATARVPAKVLAPVVAQSTEMVLALVVTMILVQTIQTRIHKAMIVHTGR